MCYDSGDSECAEWNSRVGYGMGGSEDTASCEQVYPVDTGQSNREDEAMPRRVPYNQVRYQVRFPCR
jgi:hypothetical protein